MIQHIGRTLAALALAIAPALGSAPAQAALHRGPATPAVIAQLEDAISVMLTADEDRSGYSSSLFPHWNDGRNTVDDCSTRQEVLIAEAVEEPTVGPGCTLAGGRWVSYYDAQSVTRAASLEVDHVVPLAEAWGSGARTWTTERREAYANDQAAPATLAAVTARMKREKADQDITGWLPPESTPYCRYIGEWVGTKLRWGLSTDKDELESLKLFADGPCETTIVRYTPAPGSTPT
ncbi:HNH endonuclease [Streptomyces sp. NPDC020965]|uniref:HNH endonuclease n=1 Tax=Streptomyces sp. NPDC020965 TaxID=3365105 RepID=UPI00379FAE97